jgi:hypothetical protein
MVLKALPGWAVEVKLLRLLGDNGTPNGNMLMHILSPYASDHSALSDCAKLLASGFVERKAILIVGYDSSSHPLEEAVWAFRLLVNNRFEVREAASAPLRNLIHPVHSVGSVYGWEVLA